VEAHSVIYTNTPIFSFSIGEKLVIIKKPLNCGLLTKIMKNLTIRRV